MSKVASVSGGSPFRVKCIMCGINPVVVKWNRSHYYLIEVLLFLPDLKESSGLFGWSRQAGQQRRSDQLLWSPKRHTSTWSAWDEDIFWLIHMLYYLTVVLKFVLYSQIRALCFSIICYFSHFNNTGSFLSKKKANLPWFLHPVWFSWMHIQTRCRCWSASRKWKKWECGLGPGRSSPTWAF